MVTQVIDGLEIASEQQEAIDIVHVIHFPVGELRLDVLDDGLAIHELIKLVSQSSITCLDVFHDNTITASIGPEGSWPEGVIPYFVFHIA